MHATGLVCHKCGHRETDPVRGPDAILARGWWAQAMTTQRRHLCGACYQGLDAMARELYWRRHPIAATVVDAGPSRQQARGTSAKWVRPRGRIRGVVPEFQAKQEAPVARRMAAKQQMVEAKVRLVLSVAKVPACQS